MGSEAVVADELVLKLPQEGAELCLYIMELLLPPRPRMRSIVSDLVAWSSRRKLPYIPRCLPGPRQADEGVKRCRM